jgi:hypothetical protein
MRPDFSTSMPSSLRTMRGSLLRARKASTNSPGFQCACMSIMTVSSTEPAAA